MTADPNYAVHSIEFLDTPEYAGLGPEFSGMGLIRISEEGTGRRATALVEHDYAVTALAARAELTGQVVLAATATRFLRTGWPEEWRYDLNPTWAPIYPAGYQA